MKKTNNKGFSLVELIIVIAIMAILIGVLAPQYIKYVEKSRISSDKDMVDSLTKAVQTACTDEDYYIDLKTDGSETVVITDSGYTTNGDTLPAAIEEFYGASADTGKAFKSKAFAGATITISVELPTSTESTNTTLLTKVTVSGAGDGKDGVYNPANFK